jgi:hypothetical protein
VFSTATSLIFNLFRVFLEQLKSTRFVSNVAGGFFWEYIKGRPGGENKIKSSV